MGHVTTSQSCFGSSSNIRLETSGDLRKTDQSFIIFIFHYLPFSEFSPQEFPQEMGQMQSVPTAPYKAASSLMESFTFLHTFLQPVTPSPTSSQTSAEHGTSVVWLDWELRSPQPGEDRGESVCVGRGQGERWLQKYGKIHDGNRGNWREALSKYPS